MSAAKVLTTAEVDALPERIPSGWALVRSDDLMATTRALETAQRDALEAQGSEEGLVRELNSAQDRALARLRERDAAQAERDAVADLLDDARVNFEEAIIRANLFERNWRKAIDERDEARATMRRWESELDSARFARDAYANTIATPIVGYRGLIELARRSGEISSIRAVVVHERDAARATVSELVKALEGLFVEYDRLRSEGSKYAHMYCWVDRPPDHACAECMPDGGPMIEPGFRCREHAARAVLEKAKEATNG